MNAATFKHTHSIPTEHGARFAHVEGCPACEQGRKRHEEVMSNYRRAAKEAGYPDGLLPGTSIPKFTAANRAFVKRSNRA